MVKLGDVFPNFQAKTTIGDIDFHKWIEGSWTILFSHPADYTPVCTTELGQVQKRSEEFKSRGVKLIALSCDDVDSHKGWSKDVLAYNVWKDKGQGAVQSPACSELSYPIISDPKRDLAVKLGMLDADEKTKEGLPLTCRAVFIIGPDKRLKLSILYPATTGRNFDEILRVVDSLQLTATKKVATPVDWTPGKPCMVVPSLSPAEAKEKFPNHTQVEMPSGKGYVRMTTEY